MNTPNTQLPAEDKPTPLITDLLPAQEVHNLYLQEMKMTRELNKEIKNVREYQFDNFGEFSESKMLTYQNGEKHTVDLVKIVITKCLAKLLSAQQENEKTQQYCFEQMVSSRASLNDARALLEKAIAMDEIRDHDLYNEIKTFLDGTK